MTTQLVEEIAAAFGHTQYPGHDNLTDSTYGEEPEALKRDFRDKDRWQNISAEFLDQAPEGWGSALSFFSDRALLFYLPAYLIADIQGRLKLVSPDTKLTLFLTIPGAKTKIARQWGGGTMEERARAGFDLFDSAQVSAVVHYLHWKLGQMEYDDARIKAALEYYWLPRQNSLQSNKHSSNS